MRRQAMNGFDDNFLDYLQANHPTDYLNACSEDAKPETLSRIYSDYNKYFQIWIKVPLAIRNHFNGRVPEEIMRLAANGNEEALRDIATGKKPPKEEQVPQYFTPPPPEKVMETALFATAIAAGYSKTAAFELSLRRMLRDSLAEKARTNTLSDEEKKAWTQSRKDDAKTIKKDWAFCQHEKMLIHLFAQYNRGKIKKEDFLPQVVDLMQKIESCNHRHHLLEYLKTKPVQAKLAHFREDVLDTLSQTILHEIPVEERDDYLRASIPLKFQIRKLIDKDNSGSREGLAKEVNKLVERADKDGIGVDLSNYTADSHHPMSAELRQMFMVACCIHKVPYRNPNGERINPNSEYVKQLPKDIQALVLSRDLQLDKESMIERTDIRNRVQTLKTNIPSVLFKQGQRESA